MANLAAFTPPPDARRYPRALQVLGRVLCAVLVATLPWPSVAVGLAVAVVGVGVRRVRQRGGAAS